MKVFGLLLIGVSIFVGSGHAAALPSKNNDENTLNILAVKPLVSKKRELAAIKKRYPYMFSFLDPNSAKASLHLQQIFVKKLVDFNRFNEGKIPSELMGDFLWVQQQRKKLSLESFIISWTKEQASSQNGEQIDSWNEGRERFFFDLNKGVPAKIYKYHYKGFHGFVAYKMMQNALRRSFLDINNDVLCQKAQQAMANEALVEALKQMEPINNWGSNFDDLKLQIQNIITPHFMIVAKEYEEERLIEEAKLLSMDDQN